MKPLRLQRSVERCDIVDVKPEIVVGGQYRDAERDECAASDEKRARTALGDRVEELDLVELGPLHLVILDPMSGSGARAPDLLRLRDPGATLEVWSKDARLGSSAAG